MFLKVVFFVLAYFTLSTLAQESSIVEPQEVEGEKVARFFGIRRTSVGMTVVTVVTTTVVPSICASLFNVTGACRRRRGVKEEPVVLSFDDDVDIDLYNPSPVVAVEKTPAPELIQPQEVAELRGSDEVEEIGIIGLESSCVQARKPLIGKLGLKLGGAGLLGGLGGLGGLNDLANRFGITVLFTSRQTATFTSTQTITSGSKPFIISGCTPNPFLYKLC